MSKISNLFPFTYTNKLILPPKNNIRQKEFVGYLITKPFLSNNSSYSILPIAGREIRDFISQTYLSERERNSATEL